MEGAPIASQREGAELPAKDSEDELREELFRLRGVLKMVEESGRVDDILFDDAERLERRRTRELALARFDRRLGDARSVRAWARDRQWLNGSEFELTIATLDAAQFDDFLDEFVAHRVAARFPELREVQAEFKDIVFAEWRAFRTWQASDYTARLRAAATHEELTKLVQQRLQRLHDVQTRVSYRAWNELLSQHPDKTGIKDRLLTSLH
ncbi:MAG: hypothetical protein AAGD14_09210 [Planctomycetota bacterium]